MLVAQVRFASGSVPEADCICVLELKDGSRVRGPIQGAGGIVRDISRLKWVMQERLREARDLAELKPPYNPEPDDVAARDRLGRKATGLRYMTSAGTRVACAFAGKLTIWTDPENDDPAMRGTRVPADDVVDIQWNGMTIWSREAYEAAH